MKEDLFDKFQSIENHSIQLNKEINFKSGEPPILSSDEFSGNHSLIVEYINVYESAGVIEYVEKDVNRFYKKTYDLGTVKIKATVEKHNFVSWSGLPLDYPWATLLYLGELYYFADLEEYHTCCRDYLLKQAQTKCPVCGEKLGNKMDVVYIDVQRIPHQVNLCSKACLSKFFGKFDVYMRKLTKTTHTYFNQGSKDWMVVG